MQFIQDNIFELFLIVVSMGILFSGLFSYRQKGISTVFNFNRLQSILFSALIAIGAIYYFNFYGETDGSILFLMVGMVMPPLFTLLVRIKKDELHIKKMLPQTFFSIMEAKLATNYSFEKEEKANGEYGSSISLTYYSINESKELIRVKWKDLEESDIEVEFNSFQDKDFVKEVADALRQKKEPINYFQLNKFSILFAVALLFIGLIRLLVY
ncbi:hypothetical protein [Sutcliffiella rhizosphaerae]|uniref:Uncharacterized protein n=1 Tax=Sutcliffiella rhizosphaerae TaxID=2880967 RepID=A0ABM8YQ62_9BACI|nr:hypothetical protein [Sutcliffiella rhizosphaerae]CAG9622158.1 hypothetical protein BACCIP111883_02949 [Sutcliffiella rhizosphaerae]